MKANPLLALFMSYDENYVSDVIKKEETNIISIRRNDLLKKG